MILGIDPGTATFGWARLSELGQVLDLGIFEQPAKGKRKDYELRAHRQAELVARLLPGVRLLVAEALSFPRSGRTGAISQSLSWGVLCGACAARGVPIKRVRPQQWQHAATDDQASAIDYDALLARLQLHVERCGAAEAVSSLRAIAPSKRTHALDAVGVATFGCVLADHPELGCAHPPPPPAPSRRRGTRG